MGGSGEMRKSVSEVVGRADAKDGGGCRVYRALRTLPCAGCGDEIAEGQLFPRGSVKGEGWQFDPNGRRCAPLQLRREEEKRPPNTWLGALSEHPKKVSEIT